MRYYRRVFIKQDLSLLINKYVSISIFVLVFLIGLIIPVVSSSQTIFDSKEDKELIDLYIMEGEYIPNEPNEKKYLTNYPIEKYYQKYEWKHLPQEKDYQKRMYTLRGFIKIDDKLKDKILSLYIGPIDYPANFYLNNVLIHKVGRYKDIYNSTIYTASNIILPNELILYGEKENEISIELFPQYEIRPLSKIYITSYEKASGFVFWRNFFNVYLIQASFILSILIFINIMINIIYRRYSRSEYLKYIYFMLICIFFCLSYISITFYSISFNEILLEKLSRIGFSLLTVSFSLFIIEITNIINKKSLLNILIITLGAILALITGIQDSKEGIRYIFDIIMFGWIIPLFILNTILLLISIIRDKNKTTLFIFIAFILIIILSIHDILVLSIFVYVPYAWLTPYGYIILVLALYIILSIEHSIVYKKLVERNKVIKFSLNLAKNVQKHFVKKIDRKIKNYQVYTYYKPMDDVSGDFYELIELPDDELGIFIADVSGHGVGSGIVTSMLKILCQSTEKSINNPSKFLKYINMNLTGIIGNNHVTAFYGIIDYKSNELIYSNASHCYPILYRKPNDKIIKLKSTGGMIGISKKIDYTTKRFEIKKGDILFFFTDGLIDTMNKKGDLFDYGNIYKVLNDFKHTSINNMVNELLKSCYNFSDNKKLDDDITIVCIEIL